MVMYAIKNYEVIQIEYQTSAELDKIVANEGYDLVLSKESLKKLVRSANNYIGLQGI